MSTFTRQHYNAIAKDIRTEFQKWLDASSIVSDDSKARDRTIIATTALTDLAIVLAIRFNEDNDNFDPMKFMNTCSPNELLYPLGELWEP